MRWSSSRAEVPSARGSWSSLVSPPLWSRARSWNAGAASHRAVASRLLDVDEIDGAGTGRSSSSSLVLHYVTKVWSDVPGTGPGYNRAHAVERLHLDHTRKQHPPRRAGRPQNPALTRRTLRPATPS